MNTKIALAALFLVGSILIQAKNDSPCSYCKPVQYGSKYGITNVGLGVLLGDGEGLLGYVGGGWQSKIYKVKPDGTISSETGTMNYGDTVALSVLTSNGYGYVASTGSSPLILMPNQIQDTKTVSFSIFKTDLSNVNVPSGQGPVNTGDTVAFRSLYNNQVLGANPSRTLLYQPKVQGGWEIWKIWE